MLVVLLTCLFVPLHAVAAYAGDWTYRGFFNTSDPPFSGCVYAPSSDDILDITRAVGRGPDRTQRFDDGSFGAACWDDLGPPLFARFADAVVAHTYITHAPTGRLAPRLQATGGGGTPIESYSPEQLFNHVYAQGSSRDMSESWWQQRVYFAASRAKYALENYFTNGHQPSHVDPRVYYTELHYWLDDYPMSTSPAPYEEPGPC